MNLKKEKFPIPLVAPDSCEEGESAVPDEP